MKITKVVPRRHDQNKSDCFVTTRIHPQFPTKADPMLKVHLSQFIEKNHFPKKRFAFAFSLRLKFCLVCISGKASLSEGTKLPLERITL